DARARREAPAARAGAGGDDERTGAVVDARGVAGGDRAAGAKRRRERRELLDRSLRPRVLLARHAQPRVALVLPALRCDQLAGEKAALRGGGGALLAAQREVVLVGARDVELRGHVLAGLRHRVDAEALLDARIYE